MKRISLLILLSVMSLQGYCNSFFSIWGGAGLATKYNYDMAFCGGITYMHAFSYRLGIGAHVFAQQYNLYYDKENTQLTGSSIRNQSNYAFISPLMDFHIGRKGNTHFYITAGPGFNIGAADTLHKWVTIGGNRYDSSIGKADNINKMVFRVGMGLTEYFTVSRKCYINIIEDVGFLANKLSETNDVSDAQLNNNINKIYKPTYISLKLAIGWTFSK